MEGSFMMTAGLILVSFSAAAMAGFGSVVIALTLGAHAFPIEWWLPRVLPLNLCLNGYLVLRHGAHADRRLILRKVLPLMVGFGGVGFAISGVLTGRALETAFGIFVVVLAAKELLVSSGLLPTPSRPLPAPIGFGLMAIAGIMHGIYAAGGPLLVYVLSRSGLMKASFRSTLALIWLALNVVLIAAFVFAGRIDGTTLIDSLSLLPVVVVATALGEWGHRRIDEARFRIFVYGLLLVAGGALVIN